MKKEIFINNFTDYALDLMQEEPDQKKIKELNEYIQQLLSEKNNFNDNNNKQMLEQYKIKLDETNKEKDNLLKQKNSLINKCDTLERKLELILFLLFILKLVFILLLFIELE